MYTALFWTKFIFLRLKTRMKTIKTITQTFVVALFNGLVNSSCVPEFRNGRAGILVATDVAARGLGKSESYVNQQPP